MAEQKSNLPKIKKSDLTELKSLAAPPELVKTLLTAQLLLLGYHKKDATEYKFAKKKLAMTEEFMKECSEVQVDKIPSDVLTTVREMVKDVSKEKVHNVSRSSGCIYDWVTSVAGTNNS